MTLKRLLAGIVLCALASQTTNADVVTVANFEPYWQGAYHAYPGMWSLHMDETLGLGRRAVEGVDFVSRITVDKTAFPHRSHIDWSVPGQVSKAAGVYGYLQLSYGNYAGSRVPDRVTPAQVKDIDTLQVSLEYSYSGTGRFNVLNEMFLLSDPADPESAVFEVGIFARASAEMLDFFGQSDLVGDYRDEQGRSWRVGIAGADNDTPFVMLVPARGNDVSGDFDWAGILAYLRDRTILSGDEWFTGIAVGVEPIAGGGSLQLDHFDVQYAAG